MDVITFDHAARRYFQIRGLQKAIEQCDDSIASVQREISDAKDRLSDLQSTKRSLQADIRAAARNEGQLPLIDLMQELEAAAAGKGH